MHPLALATLTLALTVLKPIPAPRVEPACAGWDEGCRELVEIAVRQRASSVGSSAAVALPREVVCSPGPQCKPPAQYTFISASSLNVGPVRFGAQVTSGGQVQWTWLKVSEPSPACTTAQRDEPASIGYACRVPIGQQMFVTLPFK